MARPWTWSAPPSAGAPRRPAACTSAGCPATHCHQRRPAPDPEACMGSGSSRGAVPRVAVPEPAGQGPMGCRCTEKAGPVDVTMPSRVVKTSQPLCPPRPGHDYRTSSSAGLAQRRRLSVTGDWWPQLHEQDLRGGRGVKAGGSRCRWRGDDGKPAYRYEILRCWRMSATLRLAPYHHHHRPERRRQQRQHRPSGQQRRQRLRNQSPPNEEAEQAAQGAACITRKPPPET